MHTGEWRLGHRPGLDGLRGVAVLLVVGCHAVWLPPGAGDAGVAVFFALSGFLITALLLEEHAATRQIRFGAFYLRRARRLLPALALLLPVVAIAAALVGFPLSGGDLWSAAFYSANWWHIHVGTGSGPMVHTWSLAVEEQFYLLWPAVLLLLARRGRGAIVTGCAAGIAASVAIKVGLWLAGASVVRVTYGSDTRVDGLLMGALVAALLVGRAVRPHRLAHAVSLCAVAVVAVGLEAHPLVTITVVPAIAAVAVGLLVTGDPPGWLTARWLVAVGHRSYGLYLWHLPVITFGAPLVGLGGWRSLVLVAVAFVLTELSWRLVEQPFQRRRSVRAVEPAALLGARGRVHAG